MRISDRSSDVCSSDLAGRQRVRLEEPREVAPGDRLVFVLAYRNAGSKPADRLVITNPLPATVRCTGAGAAHPLVSVDGGHASGELPELTIGQTDGPRRPAPPGADTHIHRSLQQPRPPRQPGQLSFRHVLRSSALPGEGSSHHPPTAP